VTTDHGYWLLERRGAGSRALSAVRDWILAEAASARGSKDATAELRSRSA
jgi:hypothetical protein